MREKEERSRVLAKSLRKSLTGAEALLWWYLRRHPVHKIRRQHPVGPYIADFACVAAKLIIELDGEGHGTDAGVEHDRKRDAFMRRSGWRVVRIPNHDIFKRMDEVLDYIHALLNEAVEDVPPPPLPAKSRARHLPRKRGRN